MTTSHEDVIDVTVNTVSPAITAAAFGGVLLIEDAPAYSGSRVKTFNSNDEAQADAEISATAKLAAARAFGQAHTPDKVMVAHIDFTGSAETYTAGMTAILADSDDFYDVIAVGGAADPTDAQIVELGAVAMSASKRFRVYGQSDTAALKAGTAGDFASASEYDRLGMIYDETSANFSAVAWAADRAGFDADLTTQGSSASLTGVTPTTIDSTEKTALEGLNFNTVLPFFSATARLLPGTSLKTGVYMHEVLIRDYTEARLTEEVAALDLRYEALGKIIPVSKDGQEILASAIRPRLENLVAIGKLVSFVIEYPTITSTNILNRELPLTITAQYPTSAVRFALTANLYR